MQMRRSYSIDLSVGVKQQPGANIAPVFLGKVQQFYRLGRSQLPCAALMNRLVEQVEPYATLASRLADVRHLNEMHYDSRTRQYRDWGNHTEDVKLDWRYIELPREWQGVQLPEGANRRRYDMVRYVSTPPRLQFVPHYGYVLRVTLSRSDDDVNGLVVLTLFEYVDTSACFRS